MAAEIAHFVSFERVDSHHAQGQALPFLQSLNLLRDPVPNEIKHTRLAEVVGKRPRVTVPGEISPAAVS